MTEYWQDLLAFKKEEGFTENALIILNHDTFDSKLSTIYPKRHSKTIAYSVIVLLPQENLVFLSNKIIKLFDLNLAWSCSFLSFEGCGPFQVICININNVDCISPSYILSKRNTPIDDNVYYEFSFSIPGYILDVGDDFAISVELFFRFIHKMERIGKILSKDEKKFILRHLIENTLMEHGATIYGELRSILRDENYAGDAPLRQRYYKTQSRFHHKKRRKT